MIQSFQISQTGGDAVKLLDGSYNVYNVVRKHLAKALAVVLAILVVPLVWGILYLLRRKLQKDSARFSIHDFDRKAYRQLRTAYDYTSDNIGKIKRFGRREVNKVPWWFRGLVVEARRIRLVLLRHNRKVERALTQLDAKPTKKGVFKPLGEAELWKKRTPVIEYFA